MFCGLLRHGSHAITGRTVFDSWGFRQANKISKHHLRVARCILQPFAALWSGCRVAFVAFSGSGKAGCLTGGSFGGISEAPQVADDDDAVKRN